MAEESQDADKSDVYRDTFSMFDKNGDNTISASELMAVMQGMGQNPTEEEVKGLIKEADINENGTIEFNEFVKMMDKMEQDHPNTTQDLIDAFRVFDKSGDGYIDSQELKDVLINLGGKGTEAEVQELLSEADINGDGKIDYEEFAKVVCQ